MTPASAGGWRAALPALLAMLLATALAAQGAYALLAPRAAAAVTFGAGAATLLVVYRTLRPGTILLGAGRAAALWVLVAGAVAGARLLLAR